MKVSVALAVLLPLMLAGCASTGSVPASVTATLKCDGPDFNARDSKGHQIYNEETTANEAETFLRMRGIAKGAHQTRWWNGCLQTFVPIDGHDVMKFYDPNSYQEVFLH
jgi:hypothetical protein